MIQVTVWGSRGSIPSSDPTFQHHGGATTCLEIALPQASSDTPSHILIDCGTGLTELGKQWGSRPSRALFLQSHMHWDHIQGFPFFSPFYNPKAEFTFLSVDREGLSLKETIQRQMTRPMFPITLDIIPSHLNFQSIPKQGSRTFGDLTIRWDEVFHPSGCSAFAFEYQGRKIVFSGDVEIQLGSRDNLLRLSEGADILIMDAQYTSAEYPPRRGFGHSTPEDAVNLATEAGVKHLLLTHHDPNHSDQALEAKLEEARSFVQGSLRVDNARDRMQLSLHTKSLPRPALSPTLSGFLLSPAV